MVQLDRHAALAGLEAAQLADVHLPTWERDRLQPTRGSMDRCQGGADDEAHALQPLWLLAGISSRNHQLLSLQQPIDQMVEDRSASGRGHLPSTNARGRASYRTRFCGGFFWGFLGPGWARLLGPAWLGSIAGEISGAGARRVETDSPQLLKPVERLASMLRKGSLLGMCRRMPRKGTTSFPGSFVLLGAIICSRTGGLSLAVHCASTQA